MRKGFTLLELLIVVIVIGILATIAIPQFLTSVERSRVAKAKSALGMIAQAEKMYRAEHDVYIADPSPFANLTTYVEMDQIATDDDWDYTIAADTDTFTATATKKAGVTHAGEAINLTQNGTCTGDHTLRGPDCGGN